MAFIQGRITGIESLKELIAKKEKNLAGLRHELGLRTGQLRAEIAKGGTTGDPLRDLVIHAHGLDQKLEDKYRKLQATLIGKEGEFVLIKYPAEIRQRFGGPGSSMDIRKETHFRIGILVWEELRLNEYGTVTLPVDQYLQGIWPQSFVYQIYTGGEVTKADFFRSISLEDAPMPLLRYLENEHCAPNLLVGDHAVLAELKNVRGEKFFQKAARAFKRLILEPTEG